LVLLIATLLFLVRTGDHGAVIGVVSVLALMGGTLAWLHADQEFALEFAGFVTGPWIIPVVVVALAIGYGHAVGRIRPGFAVASMFLLPLMLFWGTKAVEAVMS